MKKRFYVFNYLDKIYYLKKIILMFRKIGFKTQYVKKKKKRKKPFPGCKSFEK